MYMCQDRILPLVEKQAFIEATDNNLRDVSLCVCCASGWVIQDDAPSRSTHVLTPEGNTLVRSDNSDADGLLRELLRRGLMPRYASDLNVIHRLWTAQFLDYGVREIFSPNTDVLHVQFAIFEANYRNAEGHPYLVSAQASNMHPALAWSIAYLRLRMERQG